MGWGVTTHDASQIPQGVFRLNGWQWHNQGMSQVQELGYLLAATTQIFRSGMAAFVSGADRALNRDEHALPADLFDGIAKCRAIRRGWAGVVTALGLMLTPIGFSFRHYHHPMFSLADADINILRTTQPCLAGQLVGPIS